MSLLKSRQIINCCHPNALMTLQEYLMDYASEKTRRLGEPLILRELEKITNPVVKEKARANLEAIKQGSRDFRF